MPLADGAHTRLIPYQIRFSDQKHILDQNEEWCEVKIDGEWQRIRFHDYNRIYQHPGLYEALFYHRLKCCSPSRVVGLLDDVMSDFPQSASDLRVLDVGAGNGMVGHELRGSGVRHVTGVDIIPEAREAAFRDRPHTYRDYFIEDLCNLPIHVYQQLRDARFNCLTIVAALGFDDIPTDAFTAAYNLISSNGWLAFNIKEDFLHHSDDTGFCSLINKLHRDRFIQIEAYRRYRHRLSDQGRQLFYVAMIATKTRDIPADYLN